MTKSNVVVKKQNAMLEAYFFSSWISSESTSIVRPEKLSSKKCLRSQFSEATTTGTKVEEENLQLPPKRANLAVQLICLGFLSTLPEPKGDSAYVNEVVNIEGGEEDIEKVAQQKMKRKEYEVFQKFQDTRALTHPWVERVHGSRNTVVHRVKYMICSSVNGQSVTMGPNTCWKMHCKE